jgi:hypothetical protein
VKDNLGKRELASGRVKRLGHVSGRVIRGLFGLELLTVLVQIRQNMIALSGYKLLTAYYYSPSREAAPSTDS